MKRIGIGMFAVAATMAVATAATPKAATLFAPADLKWAEAPNTGGVKFAPLAGDMTKRAHEIMVTFPAGSKHPLHTHTATIKMVVVSGTFLYGAEGGPEQGYGPGSYIVIPGGVKHSGGCTDAAPCVVYHQASGKFDLKPVK